ncbi:MAG: hypothetical protein Kow0031_26250 [Anaerolineae bacterium]
MFLIYGLDNNSGELVRIGAVPRGKTDLVCPYCGGPLIARRGKILAAHLAHAWESCRPVHDYPGNLPLLDFNLFRQSLTGPQARDLNKLRDMGRVFMRPGRVRPAMMSRLAILDFVGVTLSDDLQRLIYWTTPRAEAFFLRLDPAAWLDFAAHEARRGLTGAGDDVTRRLLEAELTLWQSLALYLLRVEAIPGLVKIGVTARPVEERVAEVRRDLAAAGYPGEVEVLRYKPGCGAVEAYLKALWQQYRAKIGPHQEYFRLNEAYVLDILDRVTPPAPRPPLQNRRQRWRCLFAGTEQITNEWARRYEPCLRFVDIRDRHGCRRPK